MKRSLIFYIVILTFIMVSCTQTSVFDASEGANSKTKKPKPPGMVTAIFNNGTIDVTWDPVPGATAYIIYRKENGGEYHRLFRNESEGVSYSDGTYSFDTDIAYYIRACKGQTTSSYSRASNNLVIQKSMMIPEKPQVISFYAVQTIYISWEPDDRTDSYALYRTCDTGEELVYKGSDIDYTDSDLEPSLMYYYRLALIKNGLEYAKSESVLGVCAAIVVEEPHDTDATTDVSHDVVPLDDTDSLDATMYTYGDTDDTVVAATDRYTVPVPPNSAAVITIDFTENLVDNELLLTIDDGQPTPVTDGMHVTLGNPTIEERTVSLTCALDATVINRVVRYALSVDTYSMAAAAPTVHSLHDVDTTLATWEENPACDGYILYYSTDPTDDYREITAITGSQTTTYEHTLSSDELYIPLYYKLALTKDGTAYWMSGAFGTGIAATILSDEYEAGGGNDDSMSATRIPSLGITGAVIYAYDYEHCSIIDTDWYTLSIPPQSMARITIEEQTDGTTDNLIFLPNGGTTLPVNGSQEFILGNTSDLTVDKTVNISLNPARTAYTPVIYSILPSFTPMLIESPVVEPDTQSGALTITWEENGNEDTYVLYRSMSSDNIGDIPVYEGTNTRYTDTGILPDTTYYYRIALKKADSIYKKSAPAYGYSIAGMTDANEPNDTEQTATILSVPGTTDAGIYYYRDHEGRTQTDTDRYTVTIPAGSSALVTLDTFTGVTDGQLLLTIDGTSSPVAEGRIVTITNESAQPVQKLLTVTINDTLVNNRAGTYRISVQAIDHHPRVSGITCVPLEHDNGISLTWNAVDNIDYYRIYRYENTNDTTADAVFQTPDNTIFDGSAVMDTPYFYRIACVKTGLPEFERSSPVFGLYTNIPDQYEFATSLAAITGPTSVTYPPLITDGDPEVPQQAVIYSCYDGDGTLYTDTDYFKYRGTVNETIYFTLILPPTTAFSNTGDITIETFYRIEGETPEGAYIKYAETTTTGAGPCETEFYLATTGIIEIFYKVTVSGIYPATTIIEPYTVMMKNYF